jgi:hypothetical protein
MPRSKMNRILTASVILGALMALALPPRAAHSQNGLPQLAAQFVQWSLSLPNDVNPVVDQTGALCMLGQEGPVWFLAGTFSGATITRNCTVPEGTTLFFPIINGFAFNTPNCGQPGDLNTVKQLKQFYFDFLTGFVNKTQDLSVTVNGRRVASQRVESVPFPVAYPPGGVFGPDACAPGVPLTPGIYSPGLTDGFWVKLENLKASSNPYTIKFHGESVLPGNCPGNFCPLVQDITYNLTVTPVSLK